MQRVAVTGRPGIGKTTFCLKIFNLLRKKGNKSVCGFITREVREGGRRIGFVLENLITGEKEWLAKVGVACDSYVKVGKYSVFVESVDNFSRELDCEYSKLVIIDEIGPMELKSRVFIDMVENLLSTDISCLFTIHLKSNHRLLRRIRDEFNVYFIDEKNRDTVIEDVVRNLNE